MAKKEKSVGWSYDSNAGVVFGSVLSNLAGHSEKASTIQTLLKSYANQQSIYSGSILFQTSTGTPMKGLPRCSALLPKPMRQWVKKQGCKNTA